jgi:Zn-dependent protease
MVANIDPYWRLKVVSEQRRKGWSIQVGTVGDIPIRIHVTFLALLVWLLFGTTNASALHETMFVVAVFVCVLLHELGHALTAKRFGVQTNDITLYPFGGVASITSEPGPKAELAIAIAGPIVNIIIAAVISAWITIPDLTKIADSQINIYVRLFYTNIALAVFNLLPALPMDGGRVLRACLVLCKVERSTMIAARISQGLCLVLAVSGLYLQQPMLFIIAILVFLGAMQEHIRVETKAMATAFSIDEAMIPKERLESFPHGTTISRAIGNSYARRYS